MICILLGWFTVVSVIMTIVNLVFAGISSELRDATGVTVGIMNGVLWGAFAIVIGVVATYLP